jgi:hypothetical protein
MTDNAATAFIRAQANMGAATKSAKNPFFKNTYADLTAIQEAVFPAFHAEGFAIIQQGGADEFGRYMETQMVHTTGQVFSSRVYLECKPGDMQALGSAITYARRYGLMALSGIPTVDDDGNAATGRKQEKADPNRAKSAMLIEWIEAADVRSLETGLDKIKSQIKELQAVSQPLAVQVYNVLKAKAEKEGIVL